MTLIDRSDRSGREAIALEIELDHVPAKVWRALTEPALLAEWLLPVSDFELEAGAAFRLEAEPQPGWDGVVDCELLEIEEERELVWRWVVGDGELDTVVAFTLTPTASGTRLSIVQSGFGPDQARNWAGARYGWKMMGGRLADLLETIR